MNFGSETLQRKHCLKKIKKEFIKKPILKIYQSELLIKVETDVSDFALGACLLQNI